ncbi:MAG: response regulator transcription factor [Chloroflexi bacterium]|nr:response regulator transcription factor [Chloroflexota bacterium]
MTMKAGSAKVLIVDDEQEITDLLRLWLEREGYTAVTAHSASDALRQLYQQHPDLVVLDIMMPHMDGWQVCQRIREVSDAPVIMLTARTETDDKVLALTLGADDYLTKPFEFPELLARVKALLRRSTLATTRPESVIFDDGYLRVDFERHRVWIKEQPVKLSPLEFRMLSYLIQQRGWVVTHDQLLDNVWGPHCVYDSSYVKLYVKYLRNKIEEDASNPRYIRTEWGVGYFFNSDPEPAQVRT